MVQAAVVSMTTVIPLNLKAQTARAELMYLLWALCITSGETYDDICTELSMRSIKGDDK